MQGQPALARQRHERIALVHDGRRVEGEQIGDQIADAAGDLVHVVVEGEFVLNVGAVLLPAGHATRRGVDVGDDGGLERRGQGAQPVEHLRCLADDLHFGVGRVEIIDTMGQAGGRGAPFQHGRPLIE